LKGDSIGADQYLHEKSVLDRTAAHATTSLPSWPLTHDVLIVTGAPTANRKIRSLAQFLT
jgi:hypothetical protein